MNYLKRTVAVLFIAFLVLTATAVTIDQPAAADEARELPLPQVVDNSICLECHGQSGGLTSQFMTLPSGDRVYLTIDDSAFQESVHGQLGFACVTCHTDHTEYPHPPLEVNNRYEYLLRSYDLCAYCHRAQYESEINGVHRELLETRSIESAVCTSCHGTHDIAKPDEPRSRASQMCEPCHALVYDLYRTSVHGEALIGEGNPDVPGCIDCHDVHGVQGPTTSPFHLFSPQICARCHGDEELMGRYGLSTDVLETYIADFHGTTVLLFQSTDPDQETNKPVCTNCHGVHHILETDDPGSNVIRENLLITCQNCHPDATPDFPASWLSHYAPEPETTPLVYYANRIYAILIPTVIGGMAVFVITNFFRETLGRYIRKVRALRERRAAEEAGGETVEERERPSRRYLRFPRADRWQHWLLVSTFATLGLTGLVQKYQDVQASIWLVDLMGGIELVRNFHRVASILLMLEAIFHLGMVAYRLYVRRTPMSMLPGVQDLRAALKWMQYNLGLGRERPKEGRFTFAEKAEYWALIWGTAVMGFTGFMLWNPITTARFLPGQFIPAAKVVHGAEAVLAVLAILVWHLYHVHVKFLNRSMLDGYLTEEEMEDEHPLELAAIKAQEVQPKPDRKELRRRRRNFYLFYSLCAVLLLVAVQFYISYEETAITTVPPIERVPIFAPLPPTPYPTLPPPTEAAVPTSWGDGIGALFETRCVSCHNSDTSMGELDLSSYEAALSSGSAGPTIITGDPAGSSLATVQAAGDHAGQFTEQELEYVRQWVEAGAPQGEEPGPPPETEPTPEAPPPFDMHPFALVGFHQTTACDSCHVEGEEIPEYVCSNCHERPESHLDGECSNCHTPEGWVESALPVVSISPQIPHPLEGMEDCLMCHDPDTGAQPARAVTHTGRINEQCGLCHRPE